MTEHMRRLASMIRAHRATGHAQWDDLADYHPDLVRPDQRPGRPHLSTPAPDGPPAPTETRTA